MALSTWKNIYKNDLTGEDKEKLKYIFLFFVVFIISLAVEPFEDGHLNVCMFNNLTNLPCPGCGLTRSFVYFGHLEFVKAFAMNPFGPILFFFWGWMTIKDAVWIGFRKEFPFLPKRIWAIGKQSFLIGLLVFGLIRMGLHIHEFEPFHNLKQFVTMLSV